jgi:hypothetical protein
MNLKSTAMMVDGDSSTTQHARLTLNGGGKSRRNRTGGEPVIGEVPDLRSLYAPWASMVVLSVVVAAVVYFNSSDSSRDDEMDIALAFTPASSSSSPRAGGILERFLTGSSALYEESRHHVHKPVYEENHPPLFPLSNSDRLGFALAILGLMIAAGGGIGGGGIIVPIYVLVSRGLESFPQHAQLEAIPSGTLTRKHANLPAFLSGSCFFYCYR